MPEPITPASATPDVTPVAQPEAQPQAQPEGQDNPTLLGKRVDAQVDPNETPEQKSAREATEAKAKANAFPDKYEIKAPEGMTINQETVDALTPVLKKHSISQEAFQELSDVYAPIIKAEREAQHDQAMKDYDDLTNGWKDETIKELGADFQKKMAPASSLIDKYPQGEKFRELLEQTRLGNHPEMVKFMIWIGQSIRPDSFPDNGKTTDVSMAPSHADLLFPTTKK